MSNKKRGAWIGIEGRLSQFERKLNSYFLATAAPLQNTAFLISTKIEEDKKIIKSRWKSCTRKHNMFALADYFWLKWRINKLCVPQVPLEIVFSRTAKIYLQCMRLWFCIPSVKVILRRILNYWHIYKKKTHFSSKMILE